jgi:toxin-antitoxin system PIN domain toxin
MPKSKSFWIDLPDINVWLALVFDGHQHHANAAGWFGGVAPNGAAFCRITQMGLLRLLTNSKVMGESVLSQKQAWEIYEHLRSDERCLFQSEKEAVETLWRKFTQSSVPATKGWTDAYLAAFAQVHGLRLVTFDDGFKRFSGLHCLALSGL